VADDGTIVFGSHRRAAGIARDGTTKWSYATGDNLQLAAVAQTARSIGSDDGDLYAVSPATAKRADLPGGQLPAAEYRP
jgi:outer membrane protein assembly factor BamB